MHDQGGLQEKTVRPYVISEPVGNRQGDVGFGGVI